MRKLALTLFASVALFSATADASPLRDAINRANITFDYGTRVFVLTRCAAVNFSMAALLQEHGNTITHRQLAQEYETTGITWGVGANILVERHFGVSSEVANERHIFPMLQAHMGDYIQMMQDAYERGEPRVTLTIVDDLAACVEASQN